MLMRLFYGRNEISFCQASLNMYDLLKWCQSQYYYDKWEIVGRTIQLTYNQDMYDRVTGGANVF